MENITVVQQHCKDWIRN